MPNKTKFKNHFTLILLFLTIFSSGQEPQNIDSLIERGMVTDQFINPEIAIRNAEKIILSPKSTKNQIIRAYLLKSGAFSVVGDFEKSIEASFEVKKIAEKNGEPKYAIVALGSLAENYRRLGLYKEAQMNMKEALAIIKENKNKFKDKETIFMESAVYSELGNIDYIQNNYEQALPYFHKEVEILNNIEPTDEILTKSKNQRLSKGHLMMGYCYIGLKDFNNALTHHEKSENFINQSGDAFLRIYLLKSYGDLYYAKKDYEKSIEYADKAEREMFFDDLDLKASLYELLANNYLNINDRTNYEKYLSLFQETEKQMQESKAKGLDTAFNATRTELENEIQLNKNKITLLIACGFLVILIGLGIYFNQKNKLKKEKALYSEALKKYEKTKSQMLDMEEAYKSTIGLTNLPVEVEKQILNKLNHFEQNQKFIDKNVCLSKMATDFQTNTTYLSEIIKAHKDKNFNAYINDLRMQYIIAKIQTESKYTNYKIAYLAEDCGMTYSSFVSCFKKYTGLSPSEFLKQFKTNV